MINSNRFICFSMLFVLIAPIVETRAGENLSQMEYIRLGFRYDFPAGVPHGSWDFDEWPGVDHEKVYRVDYPYEGNSNMKIDFMKTHFDKDDYLGYLKSPEELESHGFKNIEAFMQESFGSKPVEEITLLTITAHPDDESIDLGGILGWASYKGFRTVAVCVTSGSNSEKLAEESDARQLGYNAFAINNNGDFIMERDLYGIEREASFQKACKILGVSKGIFLPFPGGMLFEKKVTGFGEVADMDHARTFGIKGRFRGDLKEAIRRIIVEEEADLIFTHGTDGGYGNPMHIIVNELVTEVVVEAGSKIYLFFSTPEMNISDRITHYLYLKNQVVDFQQKKGDAFKAHSYVAKANSNFDFPWDPKWNPTGVLIKDYGWTPNGYPPPLEYYSLQYNSTKQTNRSSGE